MHQVNHPIIGVEQAEAFLTDHLGASPEDVALIGAGAWSRCFAFRHEGEERAIRFGRHVADFRKDQRAHTYASPDLPIPEVIEIGPAFDGYYAIATRVHGVPLEQVSPARWRALVPDVAAALEAMRLADLSGTSGFGGWDAEGAGSHGSWSAYLLAVGEDSPDARVAGWQERLAATPEGRAAFVWGYNRLEEVAHVPVPRSLVHGDLINRNVLVDATGLTGVLDWGCSIYGDPLYDVAWFEFWSPWLPELELRPLRTELKRRWQDAGYAPADREDRLTACYLRIGLDHLLYNAYLEDWETLAATAARMRDLTNR
jgi:hygromycin-B 4-O-kinase